MMVRKDLVIAILATFCLTTTLFLIIPTRSQTIGNYDPWLDTNADGKIDGKDLGAAAYAFGSGGDPTKDVNVINWAIQTMAAYGNSTISWVNPLPGVPDGYHNFAAIKTTGFRKLYFSLTGILTTGTYLCNLTIGWRTQGFNNNSNWRDQIDHYEEFETRIFTDIFGYGWREFDVKGQTIVIILGDTYANSYELSYYLTA